jgi:hypothetical protein
MECLAAFLVGKLKGDKINNIYLMRGDAETVCCYEYTITEIGGRVNIKVQDSFRVLYEGELSSFDFDKCEGDDDDADGEECE